MSRSTSARIRIFPDFFPKRLYLRFVATQVLVLLLLLLLARTPFRILVPIITVFACTSAWMSRKLFLPLGRLIQKARTRSDIPVSDRELSDEEPEEWLDLEAALNGIRAELRQESDTLLREREELSVLMSSISDAILAIDAESRLLFFNSRFALHFGQHDLQATKRPLLGEVFRDPELLVAFNTALRNGNAIETSLQLHAENDKALHFFSISITPLKRENGKIYGAVGVFHDVTELKRAEQVRIDFVANVSHELRTPLTAIKGYTDTLVTDVREKRFELVERFLGKISQNADRLMDLIEDLLDLSSLESEETGAELQRESISVRELTGKVLTQLEPKRASKNHQIDTGFSAEKFTADPRRVEQVLVNLVINAIKYTPDGGKIRISWDKFQSGVVLRVADNGPGIPIEAQPRLFERFYRIDKARSREMGGTGLGLAIVKHIMQRHGGTVAVRSEIGRGSEFICEFPNA